MTENISRVMTRYGTRITKASMFMDMATVALQRSTCRRTAVGVVVTDLAGTSVVSIGYNGNARTLPNTCDTNVPGECGCIHAEANALLKAPFHQGPLIMYTTLSPCVDCAKLIINSAVRRVIYLEKYRDLSGIFVLNQGGIAVEQLTADKMTEQLELGA